MQPSETLGLFTKSLISNQTKAIVPKAVIWSSVWSEFTSLCELRMRINLIFIQRGRKTVADARKEWTRIAGEISRNLTLRRLYAYDNYSFFVKKVYCLFLSILSTLFQNYFLGEMNGLKKLSQIMKSEQYIDERRKEKGLHFSTYNPKRKVHTSN